MQRTALLFTVLFLIPGSLLFAQEFPKRTFRAQLGLPLFPSVNAHLENRLAHNMSVVARMETIFIVNISRLYGTTATISWVPSAELRWFHNVSRRIRLGKSIGHFSGNYIAVEPFVKVAESYHGYYAPRFESRYPKSGVFFNYGMQRGFGRHGYWGAAAGCAPMANWEGDRIVAVKLNFLLGLQW